MTQKKEYVRGGNKGIFVTKDGYLVDRIKFNEQNKKYKKETYEKLTVRIRKDDTEVLKKLESVKSKNNYILELIRKDIKASK